MSVKDQ